MKQPESIAEFEQQYAERSGVTVEWLHEQGQKGFTCACGEDGCEGFQMVGRDFWEWEVSRGCRSAS